MNLKKKAPAADKKLPAGGQRLSLGDFKSRETIITSSSKLDMINGGDSNSAPSRPPLVIMTR